MTNYKRIDSAEALAKVARLEKALQNVNEKNSRNAWARGVGLYAVDLLDSVREWAHGGFTFGRREELKNMLLNGAQNWREYSGGGCALIYNDEIAQRLCTPSELKKTDGGRLNPNSRENWLDCQARALYQAAARVYLAYHRAEG